MSLRDEFLLSPELAFLNHGSFGATPAWVAQRRREHQLACEANPLPALTSDYAPRLDAARAVLGGVIGARATDLLWMPNTTLAMTLVARSLAARLQPGDEVLLTDHEYGSVIALWQWICATHGARLVLASVPVPVPASSAARAGAILAGVTRRTRIVVVSHITSDTAVRLPVDEIARRARDQGITVVIDGAHAAGHIDLDLGALTFDHYVGDLHKWVCAPRPTAFLCADASARRLLDPQFPGTTDPSGWLTVPDALNFHARELAPAAPAARALLAELDDPMVALGCRPVTQAPEGELLMRSWLLPAGEFDDLTIRLRDAHGVEVQVVPDARWGPLVRVSVAWYTEAAEVERLLVALRAVLGA